MRCIFTLFFLIICYIVSIAQIGDNRIKIQFQLKSVSTTSGADDPDFWPFTDDPDFFWNVYLTSNFSTGLSENYYVGETSSKNVSVNYDFIISQNITYNQFSGLYVGTTTAGAEEDGGLQGKDDDPCGPSARADYYFRDYQPGINHSITQHCGNYSATFMLRWDIEPTDRTIEVRDNPANATIDRYCVGKDIYVTLSGTDNDQSLNADYQYYWEYHFVGDRYPTYTCRVERNRGGGGPILQQARAEQERVVPIDECQPSGNYEYCGDNGQTYDPACETCVCKISGYNDIWSTLATSPINNPAFTFSAFRKNGLNNMQLRVSIRKKTNASYSSVSSRRSNPTNFFIYDPPPSLRVPAFITSPITDVSEKVTDGTNLDVRIDHVSCRGDYSGKISIKAVTGGGRYYYNLRKMDGSVSITLNINGTALGRYPVVFPKDAQDPVYANGLPAGHYRLIIENVDSPYTGDKIDNIDVRLCAVSRDIYIREPAEVVSSSFNEVAQSTDNPYAISCNGLSDGVIKATGSGGVGPYGYSLTGFANQNSTSSVNFPGLSNSGNYDLIVTDALGCSTTKKTVSNLSQPAALSLQNPGKEFFGDANQYNIQCNGGNGSVTIFTTGDANLSRNVTVNGNSDTVTGDADPAIFSLPQGTFTVEASYPFGCKTTTTVTLEEPAPLTASFVSAKPPSCIINQGPADGDGYLEITADGGIGRATKPYNLYLTANAADSIDGDTVRFENLRQGTYDVVVQDKYCKSTLSSPTFVVPVNPTPVTFATEPIIVEPSCFKYTDGKITVAGTGGAPFATNRYKFYLDDDLRLGEHDTTEFSTAIGFPVGAGPHELKIEDSKGCFEIRPVTVNQPLAIAALPSVTENKCAGEAGAKIAIDLKGGTGLYTVQWKDSTAAILKKDTVAAQALLGDLRHGRYLLEVKDARGCSNKEETATGEWFAVTQKVTDPAPLQLSVPPDLYQDVSCFNAKDGYVSLKAEGGWSSYRYSIDNADYKIDNEFAGLDSGMHTFYVRDNLGCVRNVQQRINEPDSLRASLASVTNAQCFEFANGAAELTIQGGTAPYYTRKNEAVKWELGTGVDSLSAGNYTLRITDKNGCPQSVAAVVAEPTKLQLAEVGNISSTCGSANGQGEVRAFDGTTSSTSPYSYRWFTDGGTNVIREGAIGVNLASGQYRAEVTDANGCVTPLLVAISDIGGATITEQKITTATCSYSANGAIDLSLTGGTLPYTIAWSNHPATAEDITGLRSGEYEITVIDSNPDKCKLFRKFTVGAPLPLAVAVAENRLPNCFGDSNGLLAVSFSGGNGGYTWQWANGATGTRLENIAAGTYPITLNDSAGCVLNEDLTLKNPPEFKISIDDKTLCTGQQYRVDGGVDNATYLWTSVNGFSSTVRNVTLTEPGMYQVTVIDAKGCKAEDAFSLATSSDLLKAEFLVATHALAGDTVVVIDISWPLPDGITWQFDQTVSKVVHQGQDYAEVIFNEPGVYEIGMNASLGDCRDIDVQSIIIDERSGNIAGGRAASSSHITRFEIYPNPTDGDFAIDIELAEGSPDARLRMISLSGNKVFLNKSFNELNYVYDASLERMPSGVYFVLLEVGEEKKMKRVVVK
jgi:hypothetical protein